MQSGFSVRVRVKVRVRRVRLMVRRVRLMVHTWLDYDPRVHVGYNMYGTTWLDYDPRV